MSKGSRITQAYGGKDLAGMVVMSARHARQYGARGDMERMKKCTILG